MGAAAAGAPPAAAGARAGEAGDRNGGAGAVASGGSLGSAARGGNASAGASSGGTGGVASNVGGAGAAPANGGGAFGSGPGGSGAGGSDPGGHGGVAGIGGSGAGARAGTAGAAGTAGGSATAGAAGGPIVGTPKNPVLPGLNADPQIASFGGKFFIYPTSDGFTDWRSTSFHAFSSPDLVAWKDEGVILDLGPDVSWADERAWAPGIAYKDGTYYFYFVADVQIGVATSSSPTGPFKDALGHPLVKTGEFGGQSIDPYVLMDDDGRAYLYFGNGSSGHVVELGADLVSLKGTPTAITLAGFREGSVAFKRNGTYYFMYSENDTRSADYDVAYGTAKSPLGPFTRAAVNPILERDDAQGILGPGHNSILALPNGDYYIAYHRFAIPGGDGTHREVCLDKLEFNADGSVVPVKPTR
jgi:hypothetical protein